MLSINTVPCDPCLCVAMAIQADVGATRPPGGWKRFANINVDCCFCYWWSVMLLWRIHKGHI